MGLSLLSALANMRSSEEKAEDLISTSLMWQSRPAFVTMDAVTTRV